MSDTTMGGSQPVHSNSQAESEIVPAGVNQCTDEPPAKAAAREECGGRLDGCLGDGGLVDASASETIVGGGLTCRGGVVGLSTAGVTWPWGTAGVAPGWSGDLGRWEGAWTSPANAICLGCNTWGLVYC